MKFTLATLLFSSIALAQSSTVFTATAINGNGDTCTGTMNAGSNVNFVFACSSPIVGKPAETHKIYEASNKQPKQAHGETIQFGDVICMFGVNPTSYTTTFGSLGEASSKSIVYSCALMTRIAGIQGNVQGPQGSVKW